ncbi:heterokaryon incompatibility protein-domain-containing protein, partial [Boeremia exigua]|uniref:heterokaryon incompatibility protein-domain-containing protein n=1 Tax=Boeremia exigua TaxID=749465 RepID=UPI001E8CC361
RTIRLLVIHPSRESTSTLSYHLKVVPLDSTPPYEALSYTWCKQSDGYLQCDGKNFSIRRNLREARTRLCGTVVQRIIWTDAICINQDDMEEKASQIKLMREFYNKATRILVWLGEDVGGKAEKHSTGSAGLLSPKITSLLPKSPGGIP